MHDGYGLALPIGYWSSRRGLYSFGESETCGAEDGTIGIVHQMMLVESHKGSRVL